MAEGRVAEGELEVADTLYAKALGIATYIRSPRAAEIVAKRRRLAARKKRQLALKRLQAKLAANPKDATARRALILLYLLEQDDPARV